MSDFSSPGKSPPGIRWELVPASIKQEPIFRHLAELYLHDMSEFVRWPCSEQGLFGGCAEFFEDWSRGATFPFLVKVSGRLAGFAAVKPVDVEGRAGHCIQEFFILRAFRHDGIGREVSEALFQRYPGAWQVEVMDANGPAKAFWKSVIARLTRDRYATKEQGHPIWGKELILRFQQS